MIFWWKPWRRDEDREDVCSNDDGQVTFNHLQQRPPECDERCPTPLEQLGTTDPWGITPDP